MCIGWNHARHDYHPTVNLDLYIYEQVSLFNETCFLLLQLHLDFLCRFLIRGEFIPLLLNYGRGSFVGEVA